MKLTWKVYLVLVGIFLAGLVAGGAAALGIVKRRLAAPPAGAPEQLTPHLMRKFTEKLELTPAQKEKIRPVVQRTGEDFRRIRQEGARILEKMESEIMSELSSEQRERFLKLQAEERRRRALWNNPKLRQERGGAAEGAPPGARPTEPREKPEKPPAKPE